MKYEGKRVFEAGPQYVTRDGKELSPKPSQDIWNHSPDGFNWGYGGSGPAQLALALLYDATGDRDLSVTLHQDFKWSFVAKWRHSWSISSEEIVQWVEGRVKQRNGIKDWLRGLADDKASQDKP